MRSLMIGAVAFAALLVSGCALAPPVPLENSRQVLEILRELPPPPPGHEYDVTVDARGITVRVVPEGTSALRRAGAPYPYGTQYPYGHPYRGGYGYGGYPAGGVFFTGRF